MSTLLTMPITFAKQNLYSISKSTMKDNKKRIENWTPLI